MPRKNMALDYRLTRYHRIGSPNDRERAERDRPLECALCHADAGVEELTTAMERWYGRRIDRAALRALYGPRPAADVIGETLRRGKPHERAVAAHVAGSNGRHDLLRDLVAVLADDYPLVRLYAKAAIERLIGEPLPVDEHARGVELVSAAEGYLAAHPTRGK
jgi:hypothetical protein